MAAHFTVNGDTLSRNETAIGGTTSRTMAAWVRKTTSSDAGICELNYGGGTWGTSISTFAGDLFLTEFNDVGGVNVQYTLAGYVVNTWYHLAITYDGTNARFYVNGALVQTSAWSSAGAPSGTNWVFGQQNVDLQDIAVYNAQLSDAEISQLYRRRLPSRRTNLLAYYPLHPGSGRTVDYSGVGKTLTSAGSPSDTSSAPQANWGTRSNRPGQYSPDQPNITFAGASDSTTSATGTLNTRVLFTAGTATSPSSATGTLNTRLSFTAGASTSTTSATATVQARQLFTAGASSSTTAATGSFQARAVFTPSCATTTAAEASLRVRVALGTGACVTTTAAVGELQAQARFTAGTATSTTSATGTFQARAVFTSFCVTTTAAEGGFTVFGTLSFAGTSTTTTSATGGLRASREFAGASLTPSAAAASLRTLANLAGASASVSAATGGLRVVKQFTSGLATTTTAAVGVQSGGTVINPIEPEDDNNRQVRRAFAWAQFRRKGRR